MDKKAAYIWCSLWSKNEKEEEKKKLIIVFVFFLTDIQECYEVTLQHNTEQTVVKDDSRQDAWEVIFLFHVID